MRSQERRCGAKEAKNAVFETERQRKTALSRRFCLKSELGRGTQELNLIKPRKGTKTHPTPILHPTKHTLNLIKPRKGTKTG